MLFSSDERFEEENIMNKFSYNLYRIPIENLDKIVETLLIKQFDEKTIRAEMFSTSLNVRMFFCEKDNPEGHPWIPMLDNYCAEKLYRNSQTYGAVLLFYNTDYCYAVSYGNAHFYMTQYCDINFGVDVAERLMDLNCIRGQQNLSTGGRTSKSHTDYRKPVPVNYKSGDIPSFLQGMSVDKKWGKQLICASSIQVKWDESLAQLPNKLDELEYVLKNTRSVKKLPRMRPLNAEKDASKILKLDQELVSALEQWSPNKDGGDISVPTFYLVGTKIIQSNADEYEITCNRKILNVSGDLTFAPIVQFWKENNITPEIALHKTKVKVDDKYSAHMKELIEFTSYKNNCCLRFGKWYEYNRSYLSELHKSVDQIVCRNHLHDNFYFCKDSLLKNSKILSSDKDKRVQYETLYNQELAERFQWQIVHPVLERFEENHPVSHEICDLASNNTLYFVKIGSTGNFSEAVDQASQTLERLARNDNILMLNEDLKLSPKKIVLILVYLSNSKKKVVSKISDLKSLNFLLHLANLDHFAKQLNIQVEVDFVYEQVLGAKIELAA